MLTNPTGTPITSSGFILPAEIRSRSASSAVGALPIANISDFVSSAAFSIDATARAAARFRDFGDVRVAHEAVYLAAELGGGGLVYT